MFDTSEIVELVKRAQTGDPDAFTAIYGRYNELVYCTAWRLVKDSETALDVAADAWLKIISKVGSFKFQSAFGTWGCRITINEGLMHLRKVKKRASDVSLDTVLYHRDSEAAGTETLKLELGKDDPQQVSWS